ncbi:Slam-dependent surface lipoprotein [Novosphingobium sp. BL-8A]|uniref:Slam-dependent surface lipoprotein n=1 Tax=Novosphingobium sp. BL-8A TaxID=3127639 RepID=UPI00375810B6
MKFSHLKAFGLSLAISTAMVGSAHAQVVGESSDSAKVKIAASTVVGGPHSAGKVGINVPSMLTDQYIDFQGLQTTLGTDANGVTSFVNTTQATTDHSKYGRFDYAKVGSYDVYYGEWSQTGSATAGDHTVYYGGTGATADASVPTSGTATYAVKGISNYATNGAQLTGTFTANFGAGTVTGSIQNASLKVDIGTADIIGSQIAGFGTATASNASTNATLASGGDVSGQFFGSAAQALAGVATFAGSNQYNTAFGGTQ